MTMREKADHQSRLHALFLVNAAFIAIVSLPLVFAYPAVFARLGISTLENGFFVRLAGAWLFVEAIASVLVWLRPRQNVDMVWIIIAMKVVFILLVLAALATGALPATAFIGGAVIDFLFSIAFLAYLRRVA